MALAVVLIVMVVASVLFHFLSPWWATPLASNWKQMDDTLTITLVITGVFFVGINAFIAYMLWRYRHREGSRAAYAPDNRRLEIWLIAGTTVGIMALLAPGLFVYADYVRPPRDAMLVEVVGQQWSWAFRFPGPNGEFGTTDTRFVGPRNPLGINPDDPNGLDDIIVPGPELHLPLNRPVKVLLRSKDVLHDFYVPPIRARMNMVPGMVTSFWFTPTQTGRFDILCAQLCGVGHYNMRGYLTVQEPEAFAAWLRGQQNFASVKAGEPAPVVAAPPGPPTSVSSVATAVSTASGTAGGAGSSALAEQGRALAQSKGCVACHSVNGAAGVGPTWKGLYGHTSTFADGSTATVDDAYLATEIREPQARVVKGFQPIMPKMPLTEDEVKALIAYIRANSDAAPPNAAGK